MANHQRQDSVPHIRLSQPLPPLPLPQDSITTPLNTTTTIPQLSISTQIPYRDDPEDEEEMEEGVIQIQHSPSQPPGYEPMYDYLRSQRTRPTSLLPPSYTSCPPPPPPFLPYSDTPHPFLINIPPTTLIDPPPPSYNDLYRQNEIEMQNLVRQFENEDTPSEQTEEICKWVVAMLLIALTVACVGTAFNWGRPSCTWPNKGSWNC